MIHVGFLLGYDFRYTTWFPESSWNNGLNIFWSDCRVLGLLLVIAVMLGTLGKGADWLVHEAVILSSRWGLSKAVIGATIVSIGTTTPEAAVSVLSAQQGEPGLALGNAVGSIICDTGLILGLAALIAPLPFDRALASRLSNVQVGAGILMVAVCLPWSSPASAFSDGGVLPQLAGIVFVILLALYIWQSIRWAGSTPSDTEHTVEADSAKTGSFGTLLKTHRSDRNNRNLRPDSDSGR